jgi:hypothetical protein
VNLAGLWPQIWPNLAADILWIPVVGLWHLTHLDRMLTKQREHILRELREHLENEDS